MTRVLILALCLLAAPVAAETSDLSVGQDRCVAGSSPVFDAAGLTDLVMAGNMVRLAAPVEGAAYLAGRREPVDATVKGDLFAAAYCISVPAPGHRAAHARRSFGQVRTGRSGGFRRRSGPADPDCRMVLCADPDGDRNPDTHHMFISLGCACENLSVAAASRGRPGAVNFDPAHGEISFASTAGAAADTDLSDAIPLRQSTLGLFDGSALNSADLGSLTRAARGPGVELILITDRVQVGRLADLVATANTAQIADPAFMTELKHWMRFSPRRATATGDGLFSATSGNPAMPDWPGPPVLDRAYTADAENKNTAAKVASSAGLAVFVGTKQDATSWVQVGRACQRFALQATAPGLKHAFLNQTVEVARLRPDLANLIGMPGRRPDLVMRFGRGASLPYSARRPINDVMI